MDRTNGAEPAFPRTGFWLPDISAVARDDLHAALATIDGLTLKLNAYTVSMVTITLARDVRAPKKGGA